MREKKQYTLENTRTFKRQLIEWSRSYSPVCIFDSNGYTTQNETISSHAEDETTDFLAGVGSVAECIPATSGKAFDQLHAFLNERADWKMGYLSYDLKNELEKLHSSHPDGVDAELLHFFVPRYVFKIQGKALTIEFLKSLDTVGSTTDLFNQIHSFPLGKMEREKEMKVKSRLSKKEYFDRIKLLKEHIQRGDIYEVNFCQEFYGNDIDLDPTALYVRLNSHSPAPFSVYYQRDDLCLLSASPERYLRKKGNLIYAQPIKGTARRGKNEEEDKAIRNQLVEDEKERSENIMIVDLVRNDLSRIASRGSVEVKELCGVYSFPQVHQLISTIQAKMRADKDILDVIKCSFPMGSMTGAPKIRAMELIEETESSRRGLYSGAVGYIDPNGDADFNVVIRSILYNKKNKYLSFTVGGAITSRSDAEREYDECMLKASAMLNVLGVDKTDQ